MPRIPASPDSASHNGAPRFSPEFAQAYAELLARQPENRPEPGLDRISRCLDLMGHPEKAYRTIHIAGTNGKTTTARMIEHVLTRLELRTGRFTSPHLHSPAERISLDGLPIPEEDFVAAYEDALPFMQMTDAESEAAGGPRMTFFEAMTAVAFQAFANLPVDVAVIEVGLGGTWDSTNVIEPDVTVITPIGFDHMAYLGSSIEEIAENKAGILKPGAIAVLGPQTHDGVLELLMDRAEAIAPKSFVAGRDYGLVERIPGVGGQMLTVQGTAARYDEVFLSLLGAHQAENAATAIAALEAFIGGGDVPLNQEVLQEAFSTVTSPGRAEVVRNDPTVLVDAAHNVDGMETLVATVRDAFRFTTTIGLVGILDDKDYLDMLGLLEPVLDTVVITRSTSPRAIPTHELADAARDVFDDPDRVIEEDSLPDAIQTAVDLAESRGEGFGGVVATGSITIAGEVRALFGRGTETAGSRAVASDMGGTGLADNEPDPIDHDASVLDELGFDGLGGQTLHLSDTDARADGGGDDAGAGNGS